MDINLEVVAEHYTVGRNLDVTLIKQGPRRRWTSMIQAYVPSKSGGDDHRARIYRPGKPNVGFRCDCKAGQFEKKCHAVKLLEKIADDNNFWGR